MAAGSQERRMAERQANGRPGTDKGRGAGTLEALGQGAPGARAGGSAGTLSCGLGQAAALQEFSPPGGVLSLYSFLITFVILCCSLLIPTPNFRAF